MKRVFALMLVLCLALSLAACGVSIPTPGGHNTSGTAETQTREATDAPVTDAPVTEAPATAAPTTAAPATEPPATEPPATEPAQSVEVLGTTESDAYINDYLKLRIQRPEGWTFYTEDQIAQVNNLTAEMLKDTDVAELIKKSGQITDMLASATDGSSMNLIIQPGQPVLDAYSDLQIFQLSEQTVTAQMQAAGMEMLYYDPITVQLSGRDHNALHMVLKANGKEIEEYQFWFRDSGDYMGILTLALIGDSDLEEILSCITLAD